LAALIYLDAKVRYTLNDRQWQLPARVYARAQTLHVGKPLQADELALELGLLGYQAAVNLQRPGTFRRSGNTFWVYSRGYQSPAGALVAQRFHLVIESGSVVLLEAFGGDRQALESVKLEPLEIGSIYPRHREDRILIALESTPPLLPAALLLVEDRQFYQHLGLSPRAIGRALMANIKAGRTVQGGSTITQQLVKNVFLSRAQTIWRKAVEALMALLVELHFSKNAILESYINEVYLGQEGARSIHGFALASKHYFNRPLAELTTGQIATLVGMIKGPIYYNPWRHPERTRARRDTVLQLMAQHEVITAQQLERLQQQDLGLAKTHAVAGVYPAYLDLVRRQLRRDYSAANLQSEGMNIFTSFDPVVQHHAEQSLADVLVNKPAAVEGAMVVTDVSSGDVVAVVGGRNMRYAGFNRALDAVRPVGSLIKPAIYLVALERPADYTLAAPIRDVAVSVKGGDGKLWQPRNFDRLEHGDVLLHRALSRSYNLSAARLGMELGLESVLAMVKRLGVSRPLPVVPSVLLGSGALSPLEVAAMYQTIAASGIRSPLRSIVSVADHLMRPLARYPLVQNTAVSPAVMHLMHYALFEVVREGTGKSAYAQLPENFSVAGKTGTTNRLRDSWFAGYAGDYLSVVWLGRDDNSSVNLTGSSGALKVWTEFINRASHSPLDFSVPEGVVYRWVDQSSGLLSAERCKGARYMPFLAGTAPSTKANCVATAPGVWRWFKNLFRR